MWAFRLPSFVFARLQGVAHIPQAALPLLVLDLEIAHGGLEVGRPIDQVGTAVDQALVVEPLEGRPHRPREAGVEREPLARPVARGADPPELARDLAAVLGLPLPGAA